MNEQRELPLEQPHEERKTRRKFITWAGQFAAGASLAAVGLGLGMKTALAEPECMPCSGCAIDKCTRTACGGDTPWLVQYRVYYGCAPSGQPCQYNLYSVCHSSCYC